MFNKGVPQILNERDADPAVTTSVDLMETWSGMEDVFNGRLTRAIGLSNCNCKQLKRIYDCSKIKPCNLQIECHLYMAQNKTVSFCKNHGVAVTAYAPLGKTSGAIPKLIGERALGVRSSMASHPLIDPAVVDLARRLHRTPAQVLLRYQVQRGLAVLTRSENPDHIHENFKIFDFQLTPDQMSMLQGLDRNLRLFKHDRYDEVVQHPEFPFRSLF
ncbi:unnamed protein product [Ixodes pacificus]